MAIGKLLLVGGAVAAGIAALVAGAKPASASQQKPSPSPPPTQGGPIPAQAAPGEPTVTSPAGVPTELVSKVTAAVAAGDPARMEAVAAELDSAGYAAQAAALRQAAAAVRQAHATQAGIPTASPAPPSQAPAAPQSQPRAAPPAVALPTEIRLPEVTIPATPPATAGPTPSQTRVAKATAMVGSLRGVKKGQENQGLVRSYQTEAGLKVDGLYGPVTAKSAGIDLDAPPPNPLYWGSKTTTYAQLQTLKKNYKQWLLDEAASHADPAEANGWNMQAGMVK